MKKIAEVVPDALVISGDISGSGDLARITDILNGIKHPVLFVPGNMDPMAFTEAVSKGHGKCQNLSGRRILVSGIGFVGIGAQISGFLGDVSDLERVMEPSDILVSHFPPYGFNDRAHDGEHIGSTALLEVVKRVRPRLVLTGHVHESPGLMRSGGTVYVNPGPAFQERCAVIDVPEDGDVLVELFSG